MAAITATKTVKAGGTSPATLPGILAPGGVNMVNTFNESQYLIN
jgi:hypothetical protein